MTDPTVFLDRVSRMSPKRLALLALELQNRVEALESRTPEPIAIVGLGCRLPGGVDGPTSFWDLLRTGVDAIREIPSDRWDVDTLFDPDPAAPGKVTTRWGGLLDGIDRFDPQVFGISPREAVSMDPQQRLLLEVGWEALEHAGYAADQLAETSTGVFVGICNGDYYEILMDAAPDAVDAYAATGSAHSVASGRLSYVLGLRGPSLSVDTACSSSLVAVHLAVQSLQAGECRAALAGGVNAILSPRTTMALSRAQMMAADGRCKTFDARADGFVRSEGCGMVVLKRLSDARADGDRVLALIRGTAVNQDGRSNGLTAPNGPSQVAVIRAALASAGVEPADVSYVETHGTGTSLGDPIEVQAVAAAYGPGRSATEPLLLGSVKTNLGHLESAAGITGLIKTVLMLQAGAVPPHLHLETPNPHIPWAELPVAVPTELTPWAPASGKRLAGVSSFGFSGTNAHVILESAPPAAAPSAGPPDDRAQVLALSARDEPALRALAGRYAASLRTSPHVAVADVAYAAVTGRARFSQRLAVVAEDRAALTETLAAVAAGVGPAELPGTVMTTARSRPRVAMLFTGHGSLYRGAGEDMFETEAVFRESLERCAAIVARDLPLPLLSALYPTQYPSVPEAAGLLDTMTYAQPALFALQYALATLWQAWGITPVALAGHSGGEYAAACIAGSLSLEDALHLTLTRGRLMDTLAADGQMASVLADVETVRGLLAAAREAADGAEGEVVIAALNGPANVAISGSRASVEAVVAACARRGIQTRPLNIPVAAHSPQVEPILSEFERVAATISPAPPRLALVSTLTGRPAVAGEFGTASYWRQHLRAPVQFASAMETLYAQGCDVFLEIGPRASLLGMGRACVPNNGAAATWLPSLRTDRSGRTQLLEAVAGLFGAGCEVDWTAVTGVADTARRPVLPTYPFQRDVYWPEPHSEVATAASPPPVSGHPLLGQALATPALKASQTVFTTDLGPNRPAWLAQHRVLGASLMPAPGYVEMARAAAAQALHWPAATVTGLRIKERLVLPEHGTRAVQLVLDAASADGVSFAIYARVEPQSDDDPHATWTLHATGALHQLAAMDSPPASLGIDQVMARLAEELTGEDLYEQLAGAGVELGPMFRGVRRVWRADGEVLAEIQAPSEATDAAYQLHPALLDACFHALGAALPRAAADAGYLLNGCESLTFWRPPAGRLWSHATVRAAATTPLPELFHADVTIFDATGIPVATVAGLQLKRAEGLVRLSAERTPASWFYEPTWIAQPRPALAELDLPSDPGDAQWLVVADVPLPGAELAGAIRAHGGRCDLALVGDGLRAAGELRWEVNPRAPSELRDLAVQVFAAPLGGPRHVVYLAGGADTTPSSGAARMLDTARALLQATLETTSDARLWVVTCDSQVDGNDPAAASLWGFGRVAALEHPVRWGGLIDWSLRQPVAAAMALVETEIARPDGEDQIALRADDQRLVARLVSIDARRSRSEPGPRLEPDASYLVTGGLGGLGLKVAEWLVERGARHLLLVGRTPLPDRGEWSALEAGTPVATRVAAIRALEAHGASVVPLALDIADEGQVRTHLTKRLGVELPPLRGVFHLAAELSAAPLAELDQPSLLAVLRPKVEGAWVLHELTRDMPLDHFVLFSSTTALWGAQQLGHYAAANSFLDAFAHYRRARGLPAVAIDWGTWAEMRQTTAAQRESYQQFGLQPMPNGAALHALGDVLATPEMTQVAIAAVNWQRLKAAYEARRARPFLALVGHASQAAAASVPRVGLVEQLETVTEPQARHRLIFGHVRAEVARTLRLSRPESVDPETGLFDLGLDSLMAAELTARLQQAVERPLPATLVFNHPTVDALAGYLARDVLSQVDDAGAPDAAELTTAAATPAESLDDMSEEELAASLAATLARLG